LQLYIQYSNGLAGCGSGGYRNTRIDFVCNQQAGDGFPQFIELAEGCNYKFEWQTALACQNNPAPNGYCFVTDPVSSQVYNFTALAALGPVAASIPGYVVAACGTVPCGSYSNAGACYSVGSTHLDLGQSTGVINYTANGVLSTNLVNGGTCLNGAHAQTTILFVCSTTQQQPVVVTASILKCIFQIVWKTPLACPDLVNSVACQVDGYDLSPLVSSRLFALCSLPRIIC
jgi:insulin-like growth factor 2 receptor